MTEYQLGYLAGGNVVAVAIACLLYMMGGRKNKIIRRLGGSFVIAAAVNVTAYILNVWSLFLLIVWPLKAGEFCLGYSNNKGKGWIKRIYITALSLTCGAFLCWVFGGGWWLLIIHALMGAGTVLFAFKNPLPAPVEEILVCLLNSTIILFYPFIT